MGVEKVSSIAIENPKKYSREGIKIHCICHLLSTLSEEKVTQTMLVGQVRKWHETGVLDPIRYPEIKSNGELSKAKKKEGGLSEERARKIRECLEEMLRLRGYEVLAYPEPGQVILKIKYRQISKAPQPFIVSPQINVQQLAEIGLLGIIDNKPVEQSLFIDTLMKSHELRILQSALFSWRDFLKLLKRALVGGKLCTVKLLFGQPYSSVAKARAHTFGLEGEDQFAHINSEIRKAVGSINQLAKDFHGKTKPGTTEKYDIQLRLYYRPTAVPIYQCRDKKEGNLITLMGVYWQQETSYENPHFVISGSTGNLIKAIDKHFETVWEDIEKDKAFNWRRHLGRQKTRIMIDEVDNDKLIQQFREAYFLQPFAIYHQEKPRWIHFKCFYHNFKNEQREFLLQIAPKERIAKISRTQHGNTYYGVVVRLHDSFALFLHTLNQDSPSRVIFLNIPVGGTKLSVKSQRFAIYSNNDIINGSPYSQVMLLCRLDDEQEYDEKEFEFDQYVPFLKEKKIGIAEELWNGVDQPFNKLNEDYMYHFDTSARNIFYDNLKGHLSNARSEIYFLGLAPIHFPHSDQGKMQAYFKMHEELIREKQIRIHRLILEPLVARDFKESLKAIKRDPEIADYYKLYVARQPIPVLQDLILIDPEDAHMQTAILAFIKMRKNGDISMPIRMEVIRKNFQIIGSLYDTCRKFIDNNELVEELSTVADIDAKLLVGDG